MANVCKVAVRYSIQDAVRGVLTWHVKKNDSAEPFSAHDRDVVAARVFAWWDESALEGGHDWPAERNKYGATFRLETIEVQAIQPFLEDKEEHEVIASSQHGALDIAGSMWPPQTAACVTLHTSSESRRTRGRLYLPAFATPDSADLIERGAVDEASRQGYIDSCAHLWAHLAEDPESDVEVWRMAVYSRLNGTAEAVTHFSTGDTLATQRRRRLAPHIYQYGEDGVPA